MWFASGSWLCRDSGWAADIKWKTVIRTPGWVFKNVSVLTQRRLFSEVLYNNLPCLFPCLTCGWSGSSLQTPSEVVVTPRYQGVPQWSRGLVWKFLLKDIPEHWVTTLRLLWVFLSQVWGSLSLSFSDIWLRLPPCKLQRSSIPNLFPSQSLFQVPCHSVWPCYSRSWWLKRWVCAYDCKYKRHRHFPV